MEGFRQFLLKSNALALAIGVIIAGALAALVNSLVSNLLNPIIGRVLSGIDLNSLAIPIGMGNVTQADGTIKPEVLALKIGAFISTLINFVIIMAVAYWLAKTFAKELLGDAK